MKWEASGMGWEWLGLLVNSLYFLLLFTHLPHTCQAQRYSHSLLSSFPTGINGYAMDGSKGQAEGTPSGGTTPLVKDVSAMCMSGGGGMHAHIEFDRPFSGRVYSLGYGNVHECIYFNGFYSKSVLFSIPLHGCGTQTTQNTRQVIDMVENRVYVQIDKYTMTEADKKYAFVCELAPIPNSPGEVVRGNEIRRRPVSAGFLSSQQSPVKPIVPENAPRDHFSQTNVIGPTKPIVPAMLFYGNKQWHIPPENVNFKSVESIRRHSSASDTSMFPNGIAEYPTVVVPVAGGGDPFQSSQSSTGLERLRYESDRNLEKEINDLNNGVLSVNDKDKDLLSPETSTRNTAPDDPFEKTPPASLSTPLYATSPAPPLTPEKPAWAIVPLFRVSMMSSTPSSTTTQTTTEVVRMYASQKPAAASSGEVDRSIYLEIRRGGNTPADSSRVEGVVKIGEPITLVVHAKATSKDPNQYSIFVHSCYSSDGTDAKRVELIDNSGCAIHPQVLGTMQRQRSAENPQEIEYYFSMKAFKFPVNNDVYFFCSVDISPDYNFPELCPAGKRKKLARRDLMPLRESHLDRMPEDSVKQEETSTSTKETNVGNIVHEVKIVSKNVAVQLEEDSKFNNGYVFVKGVPAEAAAQLPWGAEKSSHKESTSSSNAPPLEVYERKTITRVLIGTCLAALALLFITATIIFVHNKTEEIRHWRRSLTKMAKRTAFSFRFNNNSK